MTDQPDEFEQRRMTFAHARGGEPVPPISVLAHMRFGSGLTDPLDFLVLDHIMFAGASGRDITVAAVLESLKKQQIQASNGSGVVGRDAVWKAFAHLQEAGFLHRSQGQPKGRFAPVVYEVFMNPAWNPNWDPSEDVLRGAQEAKPQVVTRTALPGTVPPAETHKTAGRDAHGTAGHGSAGHGDAGHGENGKTAGRDAHGTAGHGKPSPPHPPEGGRYTSPQPPTTGRAPKGDRYAASCELHPADYQPSTEETAAAEAFLRQLPGKWAMPIDKARMCAPLLASYAHTQGHKLDTFLELLLTQDDPDPKKSARRPVAVMPIRIRDLRPRESRTQPEQAPQQGGLVPWCGECNNGQEPSWTGARIIELEDGRGMPCRDCHPKYATTRA